MRMPLTQYLDMIAAHLNAPYGLAVSTDDLAAALRMGSLSSIHAENWVKELIASMFIEMEPEYIGRASFEAGVRLEEADALYRQARVEFGLPRSERWEDALKEVL